MKKPKKLPKGISYRSDGRYSARFVDRTGKRREKYFKTMPEARNWLETAKYEDKHGGYRVDSDMTVDKWFTAWMESIRDVLADNTLRNYTDRYTINIQPIIGGMRLSQVKPIHCQRILNKMDADGYAASTVGHAYTTLGTMFRAAIANDLITKHPLDTVKLKKAVNTKKDVVFLTVDEQEAFLAVAKHHRNYEQYSFLLETGLRIGEMIALTWDDIDWDNHTISIRKSMEYRYETGVWKAGPPKTLKSYRTIPITDKAYSILQELYKNRKKRKEAKELSQVLTYEDKRTGEKKNFCMRNLVFLNWRTGMPTKTSSYDTYLNKITQLANIKHISAHSLRHTYATRAVERGVSPYVLQNLLGHESIQTTMGTYVHATDESLYEAVRIFEGK